MRTRTRLFTLLTAAALAGAGGTASASAAVTHAVRRGETLTSVAATDGLTVDQLAAANGLPTTAELTAGTELVIPAQDAPAVAAPASAATAPSAATTPAPGGGYIVRRGDTLTAIAARYGTTLAALAAANDLSPDGVLLSGRTLTLPGVAAPSQTVITPAPESSPVGADVFVSPSQVGQIAEQGGVSAPLAEAIADQESGFNDAEVSSTGAVGVMQIEPQTWRDLSQLDGLDLSPDSPLDNVRGGVAVLQSLLAQSGGDESQAIAGYYQGLASVRAHGMFADTQRYVRDVLALQARFGG